MSASYFNCGWRDGSHGVLNGGEEGRERTYVFLDVACTRGLSSLDPHFFGRLVEVGDEGRLVRGCKWWEMAQTDVKRISDPICV